MDIKADIKTKPKIVVRGGGDLATGVIHRLWRAKFSPIVLETETPAAIRRQVSVCEAVYEGEITIEGMRAKRASSLTEALKELEKGTVPVVIDPEGRLIGELGADIVIDAIMAKRNLGTNRDMAELTIALGPGFTAGVDVDYAIETKRGHDLGRIIAEGSAVPNTGIPGNIGGYTSERVIHSPCDGILKNVRAIGDIVKKGEPLAYVENEKGSFEVSATIDGILRGILRDGYRVQNGLKTADIDPRLSELENCFTISDKARCIGGSVLELVCRYVNDRS